MITPFLGGGLSGAAEWHVWATSAPGGDGGAQAPFTRLQDALDRAATGDEIVVAQGVYDQALTINRPVTIRGEGRVLLASPVAAPSVLQIGAPAALSNLRIEGGQRGIWLKAGTSIELREVELRGQPAVAIDCGRSTCKLEQVQIKSSFEGAVGIRAEGALTLDEVEIQGPFRRSVELIGARASLKRVEIEGSIAGVQSQDSTLIAEDLVVRDTRGPGIFLRGGGATLRDVSCARNEFALMASDGARVSIANALIGSPRVSGVAELHSTVRLADVVQIGGGTDAAVTGEAGALDINGAILMRPGPSGVRAERAKLNLDHLTVIEPREEAGPSFGNMLFSFADQISGVDWTAVGCPGPALEVQLGGGRAADVSVDRGGIAALDLENHGLLDVAGLDVRQAPGVGVACIEGGQSHLVIPRFDRVAQGDYLVDCSCQVSAWPASLRPTGCGDHGTEHRPAP